MIVELLEHVSLESHEYVNDILPTIQQSYKDVSSKAQFQYERPRLVHNSSLQDNVSNSCYYGIRLTKCLFSNKNLKDYIHHVQNKNPQYSRRKFDKFRHIFIIFGTNHLDTFVY